MVEQPLAPRPIRVGFAVEKVTARQVFPRTLIFSQGSSIP